MQSTRGRLYLHSSGVFDGKWQTALRWSGWIVTLSLVTVESWTGKLDSGAANAWDRLGPAMIENAHSRCSSYDA